jgi:hypothetical protein
MSWRSTSLVWGKVTRWLHWIPAVVVIFGLTHGYWMANMLPRPQRLPHYWFHSLVFVYFGLLLLLRIVWRLSEPTPAQPAQSAAWEKAFAHLGHYALYVLMNRRDGYRVFELECIPRAVRPRTSVANGPLASRRLQAAGRSGEGRSRGVPALGAHPRLSLVGTRRTRRCSRPGCLSTSACEAKRRHAAHVAGTCGRLRGVLVGRCYASVL